MNEPLLPSEENMPRRGFLKIAIAIFNALIALVLAIPGLGYLLTPVFRKGATPWIELGSVGDFKSTVPQKATFTYVSESGYTRKARKGFVWVRSNPDAEQGLTVLSAVCTHTGCNVAWHSDVDKFICPCHEGTYNINGEVIAGPPPKPLAKLPVRIEKNQISVQLQA
ncbi:Rieske 2Fe-2S domain-containing protein [candidate division KSB1 bacterium]|nr:Rieske 2Fe-2S domain-containing protein [candidate division KSB1 bacterium]NIR69978.1 Rieske 2Fe-2S domain-containing protein [candidate division KSB1 bacterium]NIS25878.1 Rieske 2Fe-2S domain-containing protein [candidate division KSB1 bacterium]NIT72754.1 Rieske 2Fe-2S domain-containing protein [candidate division KSB1 bacterium]NIU26566.1 Rieske 2Fe-2S domain-containing protein [candidate division KSB1 bacterium]